MSSIVPVDLRRAGTITFRQTTYWDVRSESNVAYRIHFREKAEFAVVDTTFETIEICDAHPLLVQYEEPLRSLYFSGTPLRPGEVSHDIELAIREASNSWRGLKDYESSHAAAERSLRYGHGMLMSAPVSICSVVAHVLEAAGVQTSILNHAPARPGLHVLLLGRTYVVARGFAFEQR